MSCPKCTKEIAFKVPMVKYGHMWYCRRCGYKIPIVDEAKPLSDAPESKSSHLKT